MKAKLNVHKTKLNFHKAKLNFHKAKLNVHKAKLNVHKMIRRPIPTLTLPLKGRELKGTVPLEEERIFN